MKQLVIPIHAHTTTHEVVAMLARVKAKDIRKTAFRLAPDRGVSEGHSNTVYALTLAYLAGRLKPEDGPSARQVIERAGTQGAETFAEEELGLSVQIEPVKENTDANDEAFFNQYFGIFKQDPYQLATIRDAQWPDLNTK